MLSLAKNKEYGLDLYHRMTNRISLTIAVLFICNCSFPTKAIAKKEITYKMKGAKGEIRCIEKIKSNKKILSNANYDEMNTRKDYEIQSIVDPSFPGYYMDIHDKFVLAFHKSFSYERLTELSKVSETIFIGFDIDQDGKILGMWFVLSLQTMVTPDEILTLDNNLKSLIDFKPIRKTELKFLDVIYVRTNFTEILNGEIPYIRKSAAHRREIGEIEEMKKEVES